MVDIVIPVISEKETINSTIIKMHLMTNWCNENIGEKDAEWHCGYNTDFENISGFCFTFTFKKIEDAILFKLTWS